MSSSRVMAAVGSRGKSPTGAALLGLTGKPPEMRWLLPLAPVSVRPEVNSEGEENRVCFPHGITSYKRAVLPSLPRYDTAEHATQPIGLLPHL